MKKQETATVIWWLKNENIRYNRMQYFNSMREAEKKAKELLNNNLVDKVNISLGQVAPSDYTIVEGR